MLRLKRTEFVSGPMEFAEAGARRSQQVWFVPAIFRQPFVSWADPKPLAVVEMQSSESAQAWRGRSPRLNRSPFLSLTCERVLDRACLIFSTARLPDQPSPTSRKPDRAQNMRRHNRA